MIGEKARGAENVGFQGLLVADLQVI